MIAVDNSIRSILVHQSIAGCQGSNNIGCSSPPVILQSHLCISFCGTLYHQQIRKFDKNREVVDKYKEQ